jgi:hypothetical protein
MRCEKTPKTRREREKPAVDSVDVTRIDLGLG